MDQDKDKLIAHDKEVLEWMLSDLPPDIVEQMWQITSVLFKEYKRQGSSVFYLPPREQFGLKDEVVINILKNFQRRKLTYIETTVYKDGKSFELNLLESDEVYGHENTKVQIWAQKQFVELHRRLLQLRANQARKLTPQHSTQSKLEERAAKEDR